MTAVFFYFFFLLNSADSCLKINYAEPPACACKSLALDSLNMQNEIGSVDFYQNVSAHSVKAPIISIDDCSGTVYCEGDYSLVVFDTDKVTMFDKYSADGFCDSYTQTWKMGKDGSGSFTTFKSLRGLCVDYSPPKNCMSCPLDVLQPPSPEIHSTHQSSKELEPINGCRRLYLECSRVKLSNSTVTCHAIKIIDNNSITQIEETATSELATTILTCSDDGTYYYEDKKNITSVHCSYPKCIVQW
ncbi:hypothetical protein CAEBREN_04592 [Caenorhabditis brenneri]|uniref:DUF281 domain-containing protein n=1 Tax=Caenorhabditis brenneri TaxID=135651 RepID=G0P5W0_CAEBE|nr:hypothetical protein CAEBREN_04592 [Caenorhabditis brenneri]